MKLTAQNKAYTFSIAFHLIGAGIVSLLVFDASPAIKELPPIKIRIIEPEPPEKSKPERQPQHQMALLEKPKTKEPEKNPQTPAKPASALIKRTLPRQTIPTQIVPISPGKHRGLKPKTSKAKVHARPVSTHTQTIQVQPLPQSVKRNTLTFQRASLVHASSRSRANTSATASISPQSSPVNTILYSKGTQATKQIHSSSNQSSQSDISSRYGDIKAIKFSENNFAKSDSIKHSLHPIASGERKITSNLAITALSDSVPDLPAAEIGHPTSESSLKATDIKPQFDGQIISASFDSEWMNTVQDPTPQLSSADLGRLKGEFTSQVRSRIAQNKEYPQIARKRLYEGQPVVAFTLAKNGAIIDLALHESSSYNQLDSAALSAVRKAMPYPPIPDPLGLESITFLLPIIFSLNLE